MAFDLLIKNGTVVDGTGAPADKADVAIAGGKIVEVGKKLVGKAHRVIDASNLIVTPGFVDPHTHYDAQICWDPQVTSSSWNGVTTVLMGNCGVGIAPCKTDPHSQDVAAWDLVNLEAIPIEVLKTALTWDWETFPQYMDAAQRRGTAINLRLPGSVNTFQTFRDGARRARACGKPRGNDENQSVAARSGGSRRDGFLHHHLRRRYRLPGQADRLPAGKPRGTG